MNNDAIDVAYKEAGSAVAVREDQAASPALFGTSDPVEVVQKAVRVADALKAVVVAKKLVSNIQGKEYPQVEAWLTLAAMLRLTTICEWSRPVDDGWEARVIVRDANGNTIGAAEAQCLRTERSKKAWEDYAIRSMAQTRATSKSLRSVLAFVMVLAGFQPTPAEEMPGDATPPASKTPPLPKADNAAKLVDLRRRWAATYDWDTGVTEADVEAEFREDFAGKTVRDITWSVEARERHHRRPHSHPHCIEGPDPVKGHDHYCMLEWEACEVEDCRGGDDPNTTRYEDVAGGTRPSPPTPGTATQPGTREPAVGADSGGDTSAAAASADEMHRARLIKRLMALHGDIGDKTARMRHERYARVAQQVSSKDLTVDQIVAVCDDIEFELKHKEGRLV